MSLTVAMPVKNRAWCINRVLDSIRQQDYSKEHIKLVFIDGFSTDQTYKNLTKWAEKYENEYAPITVLRKESNIPEARNICLNDSNSDFILFWDSDVVAPSNGINTLLSHLQNKDVGVAGLPYDIDEPSLFDLVYRAREPLVASGVDGVSMGFTMLKKEVVDEVGFFNERLRGYEDMDYCLKVRKKGYKIIFDPTVRCSHLKPEIFVSGRYMEKKGTFGYSKFLWFNFVKASDYMLDIIKGGSQMRILKTLYYLFLPIAIIIALVSLFNADFALATLGFAYLGLDIAYHLRKTRGLFYGLVASAIFIPAGTALAYGILFSLVKRKVK